jgi:hypothetical protein
MQFVSSGTSASSGSTTVDFTINAVNTDNTEVIKTGWSENGDVQRINFKYKCTEYGCRHGSLTALLESRIYTS